VTILGVLRQIIAYTLIPVWTILCASFAILTSPFFSRTLNDYQIRLWARIVCDLTGIDITLEGVENIDPQKNYVMVSNHLSAYDIPILLSALPLSFRMAAKAELFYIPVFGQALKALGFFPVYRGNPKAAARVMEQTAQDLSHQGRSVWFAPEGTRVVSQTPGPFKKGAFRLAVAYQKPLLPICLFHTDRVMCKTSFVLNEWQWRQRVWVRVLAPMAVSPDSENEEGRLIFETHRLLETHLLDLKKANEGHSQT
jgi:1-acyl-sn-glycerol-3-phosphate acyltransferase